MVNDSRIFMQKQIEQLHKNLADLTARTYIMEDVEATYRYREVKELKKRALNLDLFYCGYKERFGFDGDILKWIQIIAPRDFSPWLTYYGDFLPDCQNEKVGNI